MSVDVFDLILVPLLLVYIGMLLVLLRRSRRHDVPPWLLAAIALLGLAAATQWLPATGLLISRGGLLWLAVLAGNVCLGALALADTIPNWHESRVRRWGGGLVLVWGGAFALAALLLPPAFVGWSLWGTHMPWLAALIGGGGALVFGGTVLATIFYHFYVAPMPEVANRAAFWIVVMLLLFGASLLLVSEAPVFMMTGSLLALPALLLAAYGTQQYRLPDVRISLLLAARALVVVVITWTLVFAILYFINRFNVLQTMGNTAFSTLTIAGLALAIAVIGVPLRQIIEVLFRQFMNRSRPNLAAATAQYTRSVGRAATLEEVVQATTEAINEIMGVRHSALILISHTFRRPDAVELIVLEAGATPNSPSAVGYVSKKSPIYRTLAINKVGLGQFDIEYGPAYQGIATEERQFFREMHLRAYVPILVDERLIGLLASGAKSNDTPYSREDIELLMVIAQQVGTALRSARLIDDLQHLNDSMRILNKRLENARLEMEKLDAIKTDFITIASHELRTPLAQIRGYTDIIDSLNEAEALSKSQTTQMTQSLRKSIQRMEELISAMMDVSQIDVDAMDLRFVRTSPETLIKMALEPVRDPADQRRLQIVTENLKGLPPIEADLQRLTQALRNIVINAIKFTPDGGTITIRAALEPASDDGSQHLVFQIHDTGVGVAEKDREYIFQKFYRAFDTQLHSTGMYKFMGAGPGLGLTIARGIIEGHGGQIWVESPGHSMTEFPGSTFFVRLPLRPPEGSRRVLPFEEENETARTTTEMGQLSSVDS